MATWIFEPGHTAAEFCVRHMMVTWVRGHFKDIHGSISFDPENPAGISLEAAISSFGIWTGEPQRDQHLRSADFLDVATGPFPGVPTRQIESGFHRNIFAGRDEVLHQRVKVLHSRQVSIRDDELTVPN